MSDSPRAGWSPARPFLLRIFFLLLIVGPALARPLPVAGQTRADSAAVLLEAARRFEVQGRTDVADALYSMILERYGDSAAAAEVRRLRARLPVERQERGGSVELQVWSSLYGLWMGVAIPLMAGADSPEPYGVGLLAGGPAGFLIGRSAARSRSLSEGQARAITWGGTWGTWQGFGWAHALDFGRRTQEICPGDPFPCGEIESGDNAEEVVATMLVGGLAGIGVGALLSRKSIPAGLATTVNLGSLWGTWFGVATAVIADADGDGLLATTLIGGNAGLFATAVLGPRWQLSRNRARLISIAGVVGGLGGAGLDLLLQPDDESTAMLIPLITSVAGLAVGAATTRNYDASPGAPREEPGGAALLRREGGRWFVDTPSPAPALLQVTARGRRRSEPGLRLSLVQARF